jgi:hypothetical protein
MLDPKVLASSGKQLLQRDKNMAETTVLTSKVTGRRELHFGSLEDIRADVEKLASAREIKTLGNWSAGQVFQHLSLVMHKSIDGFQAQFPWIVRALMGLLMKKSVLNKPMTAGFKLPSSAAKELIPAETNLEQGLQSIRQGIQRLQTETKRVNSPFLGKMTLQDWTQLHCRHCELHLSFLIPVS